MEKKWMSFCRSKAVIIQMITRWQQIVNIFDISLLPFCGGWGFCSSEIITLQQIREKERGGGTGREETEHNKDYTEHKHTHFCFLNHLPRKQHFVMGGSSFQLPVFNELSLLHADVIFKKAEIKEVFITKMWEVGQDQGASGDTMKLRQHQTLEAV